MERPAPELGTQTDVFGKRALAVIVDMILVAIVSGVLAGILSGGNPVRQASLSSSIGAVVTFAYFTYMEGTYGQTVGKKLLSLVVVKEDGSVPSMTDVALRNLLRFVDAIFFYLVGAVVIFVTKNDQRLGDLVADTYVVKVAKEGAESKESSEGDESGQSDGSKGSSDAAA